MARITRVWWSVDMAGVAAWLLGRDPSEVMLHASARRCANLLRQGRVRLLRGMAGDTGLPDASVDVVLVVNSVQIWPADVTRSPDRVHRQRVAGRSPPGQMRPRRCPDA